MKYSVFVFNGCFADLGPDVNKVAYRGLSAEDAKSIIEVSLRAGMDVVIRQEPNNTQNAQ